MATVVTYQVKGMTCAHCVAAVTGELQAIPGIASVEVRLNPGGDSAVVLSSATPVPRDQVAAALDEAGDYRLAESPVE